MFQHLDTVIAFVVLMLVVSLFITTATQVVVSLLGLRGANLRRSLVDLFETACPGPEASRWAKEMARRVLRQPTISDSIFSRFRLRVDQLHFISPETAGKLQWASASIPLLPWIMGAVAGLFITPIVVPISKHLFLATCQYSDLLARYVPAISFCQHPWRTGALVGAILGGLLSRSRLATSVDVEELLAVLEKLSAPLPGTLPDAAQRAMLMIAWGENESGPKPRLGPAQMSGPVSVPSKPYFDEGIIRRTSKVTSMHHEPLSPAEDFDEGIVRHAEPVEAEGSIAVATESAPAQTKEPEPESRPITGGLPAVYPPPEPRLEGLRAWFDHVMDRASQRFTFEARLVTVVLSCVFVFAVHFDAVRLFRSMSQAAELRAQLAVTAEAIDRQAEQFSRSKDGAHTVVPEVYRKAMVSILRTASGIAEPSKSSGQAVTSTGLAVPESSVKRDGSEARPRLKRKARAKEREKVVVTPAPAEDSVTAEAKSKAMHALETAPGFTSREEAVSWLRLTLDENPMRESLAAAYEQEVNAELVGDSDKLIDQSASLKGELARSEFKLFQDDRRLPLSSTEVPSLLVTVAFLSLGAALCYNTLKNLASLRPQLAARQDRERKHPKPA
ncbi:MAG TPA: hypothetical protein VHM93_25935 [Candidatus Acidoferrum sp.]|jgi:hypothetical protein|nr:hypothetical protein [Candidatus Acidoferrum sp.]